MMQCLFPSTGADRFAGIHCRSLTGSGRFGVRSQSAVLGHQAAQNLIGFVRQRPRRRRGNAVETARWHLPVGRRVYATGAQDGGKHGLRTQRERRFSCFPLWQAGIASASLDPSRSAVCKRIDSLLATFYQLLWHSTIQRDSVIDGVNVQGGALVYEAAAV